MLVSAVPLRVSPKSQYHEIGLPVVALASKDVVRGLQPKEGDITNEAKGQVIFKKSGMSYFAEQPELSVTIRLAEY